MNQEEFEILQKKTFDLEKKLELYYSMLYVSNELDFILNGTYFLQDDLDKIISGTYEVNYE